jgi:hypothetical protein
MGSTLDASYDAHDKRQVNRATIGEGTIIIRSDPAQGLAGLNRDLQKAQELTKDSNTSVTVYIDPAAIKEAAGGFKGIEDSFKALGKLVKDTVPGAAKSVDCKLNYYEKLTKDGHSPEETQRIVNELGPLVTLDHDLSALADEFGGFDKIPAGELAALLARARTSTDVQLAYNGEGFGVTINPDALAKSQWLIYVGMLDRASEASGALTLLVHDYVCAKAYLLGDTSKKAEYERYNQTIDDSLAAVKKFISHPVDGLAKIYSNWTAQMDAVVRAQNSGDADTSMRLLGGLMYDVQNTVVVAQATGSGAFALADSGLAKFVGGGSLARASLENFGRVTGNYSAIKPGPLPTSYAETFAGGRYTEVLLKKDTILYRAGTETKPISDFFTPIEPVGVIQSRIDSAIMPTWPNGKTSTIDTVYSYKVPAGTKVYIGPAGSQGGFYVGGTQQIVIPGADVLTGISIQTRKPLR